MEIKELPKSEIAEIIERDFASEPRLGFCLFGTEETCLRKYYKNYAEEIENFEIRDDDIILNSYPRSGSTWAREMIWMIKNQCDVRKAEEDIYKRFPFFELCSQIQYGGIDQPWAEHSVEYIRQSKSPRLIHTHLPYCRFPVQIRNGIKKPKIVYVMRNPKDVFISLYHHVRLLEGWRCNLTDLAKVFLSDLFVNGPYWKHVFSFYNQRHLPNVLFLRYEDMQINLEKVIGQVCRFLGEDPLSEKDLKVLLNRLDFNFMKRNKSVNMEDFLSAKKVGNSGLEGSFIRSGVVGGYKNEMPPEMVREFDEWIRNNISGTDFNEAYAGL